MRPATWRVRWLVSIAIIMIIVVPWTDLQNHSHWGNVHWIPFFSPPHNLLDIVGNVVLYIPFGYTSVRAWKGVANRGRVVGIAGLLSLGTEWTQLYSHSRAPSLTDVTCNLLGAFLGLYLATMRRDREAG